MHFFRSHGDKPGMFRGHASLDLPVNPICWVFGHTPKVRIVEYRYNVEPGLFLECAVCDRRYQGDMLRSVLDDRGDEQLSPCERRQARQERAAAIHSRRVANARRDPRAFARQQTHRRDGWAGRTLELNLELHWKRPTLRALTNVGARFHTGGRGSETPFDGHLDLGIVSAHWSIGGIGGRFCHWLGRGHGRDISLRIHDGKLWWKLWYDDNGGNDAHHRCDKWRTPRLWPWSAGRRKHRSWMCLRDGSIDLNPVDAFYGRRLSLRDETFDEETITVGIKPSTFVEEDYYPVTFTLERREVRRRTGPAWARRVKRVDYSADAKCDPGIPVRNHSWKGDEILGWSVQIPADRVADGTWVQAAVAGTCDLVKRDRKRYGYQPPQRAE